MQRGFIAPRTSKMELMERKGHLLIIKSQTSMKMEELSLEGDMGALNSSRFVDLIILKQCP